MRESTESEKIVRSFHLQVKYADALVAKQAKLKQAMREYAHLCYKLKTEQANALWLFRYDSADYKTKRIMRAQKQGQATRKANRDREMASFLKTVGL